MKIDIKIFIALVVISMILFSLIGCATFNDGEIKPEFEQYMPTREILDAETITLIDKHTITTFKGDVELRIVDWWVIQEMCGTEPGRVTRACTRFYVFSAAGSSDPYLQYWVILIPPYVSGEYMRALVRHELRHVYAGEYHD